MININYSSIQTVKQKFSRLLLLFACTIYAKAIPPHGKAFSLYFPSLPPSPHSEDTYLFHSKRVCRRKLAVKQAVSNVNLTIESGRIFCLLGHNGAGKTTLIQLLTGIIPPSSGSAHLFGYLVTNSSEFAVFRRFLGFCPQFDILYDNLTAYQHLLIFSRLKSMAINKESLLELLDSVGLRNVRPHSPHSPFSLFCVNECEFYH